MNPNDDQRILANAALLRLFKNEYRESGDRHSDALYVREYVQELEQRAQRAEEALAYSGDRAERAAVLYNTIASWEGEDSDAQLKIEHALAAAEQYGQQQARAAIYAAKGGAT